MTGEAGRDRSKKENHLNRKALYSLECKEGKRGHSCHQLWLRDTSGGDTRVQQGEQ